MPTTIHYGNGSQRTFECPGSTFKTVRVGGRLQVPQSQDFQSITLTDAPGNRVPVQIDTADAATPPVPAGSMRHFLSGFPAARVYRVVGSGSSQYSRCMTEYSIASAYIQNEVLYVTVNPTTTSNFMTGMKAFCVVPKMQVHGPITVVDNTHITMEAKGFPNVPVDNSTGYFLTMTGNYSAASWFGRLHAEYGGALKLIAWTAKHGDNVTQTAERLPALLQYDADICFYENGWGNSLNQDGAWETWFGTAMDNLRQVTEKYPVVIVTTLPPPDINAPGYSVTADQLGQYHRLNAFIRTLPGIFPNVRVVDLATALLDVTNPGGNCQAGMHSDALHWTPKGASAVFDAYNAVLQKLIVPVPLLRNGASDVYANGGFQLYDGLLLDSVGVSPTISGFTGSLDKTLTVVRAGGSSSCVGSLPARTNGLRMQRLVFTLTNATTVWQVNVRGDSTVAGGLLKDRLIPGHTYRPCIRAAMTGVAGKINGVSFLGTITMTGVPGNTGERVLWTGRSQQGAVEQGAGIYPQTDPETRNYSGADFTVPLGATVTDFAFRVVIENGQANSALTLDIEDICLRDVTYDMT